MLLQQHYNNISNSIRRLQPHFQQHSPLATFVGPQASFEYRAVATKFVGPHMEFRARKEPPGEGEDLLGFDSITLER